MTKFNSTYQKTDC